MNRKFDTHGDSKLRKARYQSLRHSHSRMLGSPPSGIPKRGKYSNITQSIAEPRKTPAVGPGRRKVTVSLPKVHFTDD